MNTYLKKVLDMNKVGIQEEAGRMVSSVSSGLEDPLEFYIAIKKLEAIIKLAKDQIHEKAYRDTSLSPGDEEIFKGCKIEKVTSGTTYEWKDVIDPLYIKLKSDLKSREDFLKGLKSTAMMTEEDRASYIKENDLEFVDEETGEILVITPVVKTQGSSLKITIK